tara:strand:- start:662 stop:871 length:210 start_codon:yes stop_codon:yes gene_type:complete
MTKKKEREEIRNKIISLCSDSPKTSREISNFLGLNYNTIRSSYIYKLVKENKLVKKKNKYNIKTNFKYN